MEPTSSKETFQEIKQTTEELNTLFANLRDQYDPQQLSEQLKSLPPDEKIEKLEQIVLQMSAHLQNITHTFEAIPRAVASYEDVTAMFQNASVSPEQKLPNIGSNNLLYLPMNNLISSGIDTYGKLIQYTRAELLEEASRRNTWPKQREINAQRIEEHLHSVGLRLRDSEVKGENLK